MESDLAKAIANSILGQLVGPSHQGVALRSVDVLEAMEQVIRQRVIEQLPEAAGVRFTLTPRGTA